MQDIRGDKTTCCMTEKRLVSALSRVVLCQNATRYLMFISVSYEWLQSCSTSPLGKGFSRSLVPPSIWKSRNIFLIFTFKVDCGKLNSLELLCSIKSCCPISHGVISLHLIRFLKLRVFSLTKRVTSAQVKSELWIEPVNNRGPVWTDL